LGLAAPYNVGSAKLCHGRLTLLASAPYRFVAVVRAAVVVVGGGGVVGVGVVVAVVVG